MFLLLKRLWSCNCVTGIRSWVLTCCIASFLRSFLKRWRSQDQYGKQFRDNAADTNLPIYKRYLLVSLIAFIEVEVLILVMRIYSTEIRFCKNASRPCFVLRNQVFLAPSQIPMVNEMNITQWLCSCDDEHRIGFLCLPVLVACWLKKKMRDYSA